MIIAEQKPIKEIKAFIAGHRRILLLGCKTCVTVCLAGGEKEVGILSTALRMARRIDNNEIEILEATVERQCEWEFIDRVKDKVSDVEAILSLGCGVGVQALAERFLTKPVYPALNTLFLGMPKEQGFWVESCRGCGDCGLSRFGGVCPIARCSKGLLNGPCGGSQDGKCEVDSEMDCGWQLIYDRLKTLGQLDRIEDIVPPKDWSTDRAKGQRRIIREDVFLKEDV
jgi:ferredoxin